MFFSKKEDHVIQSMADHFELVQETLQYFEKYIDAICRDGAPEELRELSYKVHTKEHEADIARRTIQKQLLGGAFLPFYRENFIKIPEMLDVVPGIAVKISKDYFLNPIKLPDEIKDHIRKIMTGVMKTYAKLIEMCEYIPNDIKKISEISEEVSKCEQEVDSLEWAAKVYVCKTNTTLDKFDKMQLKIFITKLADISNQIEDVADYIEITMIKMNV